MCNLDAKPVHQNGHAWGPPSRSCVCPRAIELPEKKHLVSTSCIKTEGPCFWGVLGGRFHKVVQDNRMKLQYLSNMKRVRLECSYHAINKYTYNSNQILHDAWNYAFNDIWWSKELAPSLQTIYHTAHPLRLDSSHR